MYILDVHIMQLLLARSHTSCSCDTAAWLYPQHKLSAAVINKANPKGVDIN